MLQLGLSEAELAFLREQGFVAAETRGPRTRYKLRFRREGQQQVRVLGTDRRRAEAIHAALQTWQSQRHLERELRRLLHAGQTLRKEIKQQLRLQAAQFGLRLHGRQLRRPR